MLIGYGRVGRMIAQTLQAKNVPFVVVEQDERRIDELRASHIPAIYGDAARTSVLRQAGLGEASVVVIATPDAIQAQLIVEHVRRVNPAVYVTARSHDEHTQQALQDLGASDVLYGEYELGLAMGNHVLTALRLTHNGAGP
ncbi:NAD-binding protein [Deinococcus malanensis]|uniref:NAD-binding protein n=1 Tax=Deinococcus malanensis TaxID=1706855 RepID=UPI0036353153